MKIVVLSGGVGGARFVKGVVEVASPSKVTVVGNVGDDLEVLGMHVSPDLDSILYALAGLNDEQRGWGRAGETWSALDSVAALHGETWFRLGDRDLGLHLVRTQALRAGESLSTVTARLVQALGLETALLPATDDRLRTWIAWHADIVTTSTRFASRARKPRAQPPECSRRSTLPTSCCSRRATHMCRSLPSSPCGGFARRSSAGTCRASRSAR